MSEGAGNQAGPYSERRTVPRYTFIATAEIIETASDTHISGRVSEISRRGCYVDLLNTLPKGTPIRVLITNDSGSFESAGMIVYVQENMGLGVAFIEPTPDQEKILNAWLDQLQG